MKVEASQRVIRRTRRVAVGCAVFLNLTAALQGATDHLHVSEADRNVEAKRLADLGLVGNPLLETPYATPFESRSYVVPGAWFLSAFSADHSNVSASALRADLPILRAALKEAYAGWKPAEAAGWDWTSWFADWDKMLEKAGDRDLPFEEAFAPYRKLEQFKIDNHSGFLGKGTARYTSLSRCAILAEAPTQPCTEIRNAFGGAATIDARDKGQQPKAALAADGQTRVWYITYPDAYGSITAVKCGEKWITTQPVTNPPSGKERLGAIDALAGTNRDVPVRRRLTPEITYYRLPTFSVANNELLQMLLSAEGPSLDRDKLTIVDLRANEGGDAPLEWLGHWTKSPVKKNADFTRKIRHSKLYPALRWNYDSVSLLDAQSPLPDSLRRDKQSGLDLLAASSGDENDSFTSDWTYAMHRYPAKPKLLILVDDRCGSDGELLAYILASAEGSVMAGVNTAGVLQHIQPGYLVLPHTDLGFRMSLGLSDVYGDDRSVDGYGLDVDILLSTPESNSPDSILGLAETLIKTADAAALPRGSSNQHKTS